MGALLEMYCTKCGRDNPDKNKFCNGCGLKFVIVEEPKVLIETASPPPPPPETRRKVSLEPQSAVEASRQVEVPVPRSEWLYEESSNSDSAKELAKRESDYDLVPEPVEEFRLSPLREPCKVVGEGESYRVEANEDLAEDDQANQSIRSKTEVEDVSLPSRVEDAGPLVSWEVTNITDGDSLSVADVQQEVGVAEEVDGGQNAGVASVEAAVAQAGFEDAQRDIAGHQEALVASSFEALAGAIPEKSLAVVSESASNREFDTGSEIQSVQSANVPGTEMVSPSPESRISVISKRNRSNSGTSSVRKVVAPNIVEVFEEPISADVQGIQFEVPDLTISTGTPVQLSGDVPTESSEPTIAQATGTEKVDLATQTSGGDWSVTLDAEGLGGVFEAAEARLDEILVEVRHGDRIERNENEVKAPSADRRFYRAPSSRTIESEQDPGPLAPINTSSKARAMKFAIGGSAVLLLVMLGAALWFSQKDTDITTQDDPAPPKSNDQRNGSALPPVGMAYVPGGEFIMGTDTGDEFARPAHKVIVKPFFIDITEVTNEEYKKFVDATGRTPPPTWRNGTYPEGQARFPVAGVDWNDATEFAAWVKKRLPREEEWEFAARGTTGNIYPWGNKWVDGFGNAGKTRGLREVGKGGKSPFGMYDMSGNVWEWTASDAKAFPNGKQFYLNNNIPQKIIRGGSWLTKASESTAIYRAIYGVEGEPLGYALSGFRCAMDP